jgi:hypothetical protein
MKSLLIINGEEHEVEFLGVSIQHKEFEDYETVIKLNLIPIEPDVSENTDIVEAVGVGKPQAMGIQKPEAEETIDLRTIGIDVKQLEDFRKSMGVVVFDSIPKDRDIHGTIWSIETRRYEINGTDPIGSAIRDLVQKEKEIATTGYGIDSIWVETAPSVKLVDDGFHIVEKVQRLKGKENGSEVTPTAI